MMGERSEVWSNFSGGFNLMCQEVGWGQELSALENPNTVSFVTLPACPAM